VIDVSHMNDLPIVHRAVIPESYLDMMGHMNVMWYTHLFSTAVGGLFHLVGLNRDYFESHQAGSFALETHIRYLAEVRAGEHLRIHSRLLGRSAKRLHWMSFMVKEDGPALAATSEFVATHIDMRVRRSSPFPPPIAEALDRVLAEHARLAWPAPVCGVMHP
jgi:acyl-CoA thioester hydrolase